MIVALGAVIGYLVGAIPVGLLVGRLSGGIDVREYGSRRTGATNVLRTLGTGAAALVFVLDVLKGVVAVLVARIIAGDDPGGEWAAAAAGLAAIVGHTRSIFIGFTGGRGVATSAGALAALAPPAIVVVAPLAAAIAWATRFVSLASIAGALLAPAVIGGLLLAGEASVPALAYAAGSALLITWAHADNIARLRAGTERRLGEKEQVHRDG